MRKILAMLLSVALFVTGLWQPGGGTGTALANTPEAPGNLITNGGYETLDGSGWASTWSKYTFSGTPAVTVNDAVYKEGSHSLTISAETASRVSVSKTLPITSEQRGKTFKFSQWVKTEAITGAARNRIQYKNSQNTTIGAHVFTESVTGTQDWKRVETLITFPDDPAIVKFVFETFFETGTGTAWYDGTSLIPWVVLEAIALEHNEYSLTVGETVAVNATAVPANASEQELVWSTSNPDVAAVQDGIVTAGSAGQAVVTAASQDGTVSASATVNVVAPSVITNGGYETLDGSGWASSWGKYTFSGTPDVTLDDVIYKSGSRSLKMSAASASRVAANKTMPVTSEQRGKTFKFSQWVKTDQVSGSVRNRFQFRNSQNANISYVYTESITGTQDWTLTESYITFPDDPAVVKFVFETFFETGTGTAWFDDTSLTSWTPSEVPLEAIVFEQEVYTVNVGETLTTNVIFTPTDATNRELVWTTSNPAIATVQDGAVTGVSGGQAVVTAASPDGTISDSAVIHVVAASLIANGSYESLDGNGWASSWSTYVFSGTPVLSVDDAVYKDGSRSLKISAEAPSRAAVTKTIAISGQQRGRTFKFSQWVKTDNVTGSVRNRIQYKNSQNVTIGEHVFTESIKGTQDWKLTETFITFPDDPNIVKFVFETFFETGTGTAWYDGTSLIPWIPVETIAFGQEEYTVSVGGTVVTDVAVTPANTSEQELVWTTSDPSVATVQGDGMVTGVSNGLVVVTAASSDGKVRASALVYVGAVGGDITAEDELVEMNQRATASGAIQAISGAGRPLSYTIAAAPAQGLLDLDQQSGEWSYYPYDRFHGVDRFIVTVRDDTGNYAVSRVTVTVHPVNLSPEVKDSVHPTVKNASSSGLVNAKDPDGDSLTYTKASEPMHGQVNVQAAGNWTYTPDAGYIGEDSFTVRVSDGRGGEAVATVRIYMAPAAEELVSELIANNPDNKHSRLLATDEDFTRIQTLLVTDTRLQMWFGTVKQSADQLLSQPVVPYNKPDGLRLNTEASRTIATLAFVYRVTGEQNYLDRAWTELLNVSTAPYPDWSPGHFLDTATMTHGVALGYDWLYDYLSAEQREIVRDAIVEKGLQPALPLYAGMTYWTKNDNNWNYVCNAGMIMGALAVADEAEAIAGTILQGAFKSLQYGLRQYAPDGSSIEGPAYWSYGTSYLVYLLSSLETVYGHDFGFGAADGVPQTPNYPVYITGPRGTFNYSDGSSAFIPGRLLLWFAERHQEPGYAWYHEFVNSNTDVNLYDILWYRPELYDGGEPPVKDYYFARQHAVTMRSSWSDPGALFAGFKGGVNGVSHSDLDTGSFVLDANGVRWATDLGSEDYNLPGYWGMTEDSLRWTYYRKRTEGHNSIVINPSMKPEQNVTAVSRIIEFEDNQEQGAYAIADLTEAYKDHVLSARRGVALTDHRRQFVVQDEIQAKLPSEMYWFMHTAAEIDIAADGRTAILSSGDQRLQVQLLSPAGAGFTATDAVPLPTSPNPGGQTSNAGVRKLVVHLQDVKEATISVRMIPLLPGQSIVTDMPAVIPLDQWSVPDTPLARLGRISLDGALIAEFRPDRYMYTAEIPYGGRVPEVAAAAADSQHTVRVTEAAPGLFRIDVADPERGADLGSYFVQFVYKQERVGEPALEAPVAGSPSPDAKLPIHAVKASSDDGNVPGNSIDGKMNTRWSAFGEQWIQYDLGEKMSVRELAIAWSSGNQRSNLFEVEVSDNGYVWEWVYSGQSSGTTADFETYTLREAAGRYVRINGHGNTLNGWNSILEVGVYGEGYTEPEPEPGTGSGSEEPEDTDGTGGAGGSGSEAGSGNTTAAVDLSDKVKAAALEDKAIVYMATGSGDSQMSVTIEELGGEARERLVARRGGELPLSGVFEMRQDQGTGSATGGTPGKLEEPAIIIVKADLNRVEAGQRAALFRYEEATATWVEVGGVVIGSKVVAEVEEFGVFAVFAANELDKEGGEPTGEGTEPSAGVGFADARGHWAAGLIGQAAEAGFVGGYPDGTFRPDEAITRAEFITMLMRARGIETTAGGGELPFTDKDSIAAWAAAAVAEAVRSQAVNGYEDGSFRPNAPITREEMVAILMRTMDGVSGEAGRTTFADDASIPDWAKGYVEAARASGIVEGREGNVFAPKAATTRAEAVVMLLRWVGKR